jgi:hypothetical protein
MSDTLIFNSNAAGQSDTFTVSKEPVTCYLGPYSSLTAAEYADLQRYDGTNWSDVYSLVGGSAAQVRLDTTLTDITIIGPGTYRFDVDNPTNTVTIHILEPGQKREDP